MLQQSPSETGTERIVIMGCGGLGATVATSLSQKGHTVHILDPRAEAFDRLSPGEIEGGHIVPVVGDGTLQQGLLRASTPDARVFMALTNVDSRNALAAQMAKHVYQVPTVVCRIDDPTLQNMYQGLGIVAISATTLVTNLALKAANI